MASTLIVEDGTGLLNADSFASIDEALIYHANLGHGGWVAVGVDDTKRDVAMRKATKYLTDKWAGKWQGYPRIFHQALPWPRWDVYDANKFYVDSSSVPVGIKEATFELALSGLVEDLMPNTEPGTGDLAAESVTVGPVSVSSQFVIRGGGGSSALIDKTYVAADLKVRPYLISTGGRVSRA